MAAILTKALSLVVIVAIGYGIKKIGWVKAEHFSVLAIIVLRITLPAALITSFNTVTISGSLAWLIALGFAANFIQQIVSWLRYRRRSTEERAFDMLHAGSYNIGAFAMPYTSHFIGPAAMVPTALFDAGNAMAAAGLGYGWGMSIAKKKPMKVLGFVATMFHSPVFIVYFSLLILRLFHISFPDPIISFTSLVGAANPFCAMLMIGIGLELAVPKQKWIKALRYLAKRYSYTIAFSLIIWFLLPQSVFGMDIKLVLMVVVWAPFAAMTSGFVDEAKGDVELATLLASITIIIAILMMPTVYMILNTLTV